VSGFLVDTNVLSEFIKPQPDSRVIGWLEAADPELLFASVVTFGEIRLGIEDLPVGKRRAALEEWLEHGLPEWFESHLLAVTKAIADRWGQLTISAKRKGIAITTADGLIAATALEHGLAIGTRNVKDFAEAGVSIVNPLGGMKSEHQRQEAPWGGRLRCDLYSRPRTILESRVYVIPGARSSSAPLI
jgi:predicted nucleic acid-binding protein